MGQKTSEVQEILDEDFDYNVDQVFQVNASPSFAEKLRTEIGSPEYRTSDKGTRVFEICFEVKVTEDKATQHEIPQTIKAQLTVVEDVGMAYKKGPQFRINQLEAQQLSEPNTFLSDLKEL